MKYFIDEKDYYQFVKNWKALANSGAFKDKPYMFVVYNILKDRDPLYGFSEKTKQHSWFSIHWALMYSVRYMSDENSFISKLFQNVNLDKEVFIQNLKTVNDDIIKRARGTL